MTFDSALNRATPPVAVITGISRGLGLALTRALTDQGWHVVGDARDGRRLAAAVAALPHPEAVRAIAGDVADPEHRRRLAAAVNGRLDVLVNNASVLGPSPQPPLAGYPVDVLGHVLAVNTVAPLALTQLLLPRLTESGGRVVNVSSDAAVVAYPG